jgi:CBS domain-containing protein
MTVAVHTIGRDQTLESASLQMREHRVRHLPVLEGGKLLGVLSQRDVLLIESLPDVDPAVVTVEEAMSAQPYAVEPDAELGAVLRMMAEHKYGAAVVMEHGKVAGIFTTIDALTLLADLIDPAG